MTADPKGSPRVRDPGLMRRLHLRRGACSACQTSTGISLHHLLPRSQGGDDCEANLCWLCGSGSSGCHGALHGNPYVSSVGVRRDSEWVRRQLGLYLARSRPDTVAYVLGRLGEEPGRDYLRRSYYYPGPL